MRPPAVLSFSASLSPIEQMSRPFLIQFFSTMMHGVIGYLLCLEEAYASAHLAFDEFANFVLQTEFLLHGVRHAFRRDAVLIVDPL